MQNPEYTLLVVDDSAEDRMLYRYLLKQDQTSTYTLVEFDCAEEALEWCQTATPDVILLDYMLPDLDGLAFLNQLKLQTRGDCFLPVVMLTGQGDELIAVQAMKSGAQDYLIKANLSTALLCRAIHSVIERLQLMQQVKQHQEQQQLVSEISLRIRQFLSLSEILSTVVAEVRQFLNADRVVVYQFTPDRSGNIVAESVLPQWIPCLNAQITDTCFQGSIGGDYRCGKTQAIADIYSADLAGCHIQLLEQFQVKANLVVPILLERGEPDARQPDTLAASCATSWHLWGLLIAHQCSAPRQWKESEVELLSQLAVQLAIAIRQAELHHDLEVLNADLETKVQERAAELQEANDRLQKELFARERSQRLIQEQAELLDLAHDAILTRSLCGCIGFWNRGAEELYGWTKNEAIGQVANVLLQTQFSQPFSTIKAELSSQGYWEGELSHRCRDGTSITVASRWVLQRNTKGKPFSILEINNNITERKQVEAALRESEERFRSAFDDAAIGMSLVALDGHWLKVNRSVCEIVGYTESELLALTFQDITYPDDLEADLSYVHRLLRGEIHTYQMEKRYIHKQKHIVWALLSVSLVRDRDGQALYFIAQIQDISDRKQAENALRNSEERWQLAIQGNNDAIWDWNIVTDETFRSPRWYEILGLAEQQTSKSNQEWEDLIYPDDLARVVAANQDYLAKKTPTYEIEYRICCEDASYKWVMSRAQAQWDEQGNPMRMVGSIADISARKMAELELQKAKELAETANHAKSMFLANMSHELRTPLNVILGFTQVMRRDLSLSLEQKETIQTIHRSGEHLLSLINSVLDLSKIEADRINLDESSFALVPLVRSLHDMLHHRAESKGLQFCLEIASDLPQYITTDANKLRQVLINLLSNAIKFTDQGQITLEVKGHEQPELEDRKDTAHASSPDSYCLHIEIRDTGIGIAADEREDIFDAFTQSRSGKITPGGTGLGLTISRRFIRLMGGEITVSSSLGQSSVFHVQLPVKVAQLADVPTLEPEQRVIGLAPGHPSYRVLVVDDQPENRLLLLKLMNQLGLETKQATNGQEAVTVWQAWQPHLIWMDIRMPIMDGYEATRLIRSSSQDQSTIIIALTAHSSKSDRTLALEAGCNGFIIKPFLENTLCDVLTEHLGMQFIYEANQESFSRGTSEKDSSDSLTEGLSSMSLDWTIALHKAAQLCDEEDIEQLIQQIPPTFASLTKQLSRLAHNYQFEQLKQLITPFM